MSLEKNTLPAGAKAVVNAILTRRSCRSYLPQFPEESLIDQIVEAGTYAASGKSKQPWRIIVIRDAATQARIRQANASFLKADVADPFYGAPVYLLVVSERENPNHVYDGTLVLGNMMLCAHALGLASCWINRAREMFDQPEWQAWLREIGLEGDFEGIGFLALGYAAGDPSPRKPRRECVVKV